MSFRLYTVRVFSLRWEESVSFYRDTIGLPLSLLGREYGWAQFDLGSASLGLERCDPADPEARELVGRFVGVSIEVSDLQATYDTLTARGVEFTGPPEPQPWGGVLAHFRDPDGNVITLLGNSAPRG
jgi:predicted enzyme related to lactoylglutathione lyase